MGLGGGEARVVTDGGRRGLVRCLGQVCRPNGRFGPGPLQRSVRKRALAYDPPPPAPERTGGTVGQTGRSRARAGERAMGPAACGGRRSTGMDKGPWREANGTPFQTAIDSGSPPPPKGFA